MAGEVSLSGRASFGRIEQLRPAEGVPVALEVGALHRVAGHQWPCVADGALQSLLGNGSGVGLCPDRQDIVPVLRSAVDCLSVALCRAVDYVLSVGTASPASPKPKRNRLYSAPAVTQGASGTLTANPSTTARAAWRHRARLRPRRRRSPRCPDRADVRHYRTSLANASPGESRGRSGVMDGERSAAPRLPRADPCPVRIGKR